MKHNAHYLAWILHRIETRRKPEGIVISKPANFDEMCQKIINFYTGAEKSNVVITGSIPSNNFHGAYDNA